MNILNFIHNNLFIIWLIGAIVSTYTTFKYAAPIKMYENILKYHKGINRICPILFLSFIICGYTVLSWIGALVTYFIFKDNDN